MDQYETEAIKRWGERAESSIELWKSYTNAQRDLVLQAMDENYKVIAQLMHMKVLQWILQRFRSV